MYQRPQGDLIQFRSNTSFLEGGSDSAVRRSLDRAETLKGLMFRVKFNKQETYLIING